MQPVLPFFQDSSRSLVQSGSSHAVRDSDKGEQIVRTQVPPHFFEYMEPLLHFGTLAHPWVCRKADGLVSGIRQDLGEQIEVRGQLEVCMGGPML